MVSKDTRGQIVVRGARTHNLKNVDITLPPRSLIVMTGVSGSGKSSLAFDTIYAEGQRRYVESLSAYARQFLGLMEKPDVDHIEGLSPAISIDQKSTSRNPRSTVGTVTEIYDYLRLLYARIGHPHCPNCGISMEAPAPRNFSFNSPHGACPTCTGLGMRMEVDADAVVPDPSLSIMGGALSGWTKGPSQRWLMDVVEAVARKFRIPIDKPWDDLTVKQQRVVLYGLPKDETVRMRYVSHSGHTRSFDAHYEGVIPNLERRYRETESDWVKQEIERLMMQKPCPACNGRRLKPEVLAVTVDGMTVADFTGMSVLEAHGRGETLKLTERERFIARQVLKEVRERLGLLHHAGPHHP